MSTLDQQIKEIQDRNKRVEADKAWETSWTRRIIILLLTYCVIVSFFLITRLPDPFLNALVPVLAFAISTMTVGVVKSVWMKNK
ncbi:MAG: hypothetical protein WCW16_01655 [Candidatus Magasanikbacteria bacterium]